MEENKYNHQLDGNNQLDNAILFQIEDDNGNPKEVMKIDGDGFHIYGERLKSADDVAAAFRHYFSNIGYSVDDNGHIVAEFVEEGKSELGKEENNE